jgi:hypothetical protein
MTQEELERISEENHRQRQAERVVRLVRMKKLGIENSEVEVDSENVWVYKIAGWVEA